MPTTGELIIEQPSQDKLKVILSGQWKLGGALPSADEVQEKVSRTPDVRRIAFESEGLTDMRTPLRFMPQARRQSGN